MVETTQRAASALAPVLLQQPALLAQLPFVGRASNPSTMNNRHGPKTRCNVFAWLPMGFLEAGMGARHTQS